MRMHSLRRRLDKDAVAKAKKAVFPDKRKHVTWLPPHHFGHKRRVGLIVSQGGR